MTHPAQHLVDASRKRQKAMVEGRARGGRADRPGKKGALTGGASEDSEGQSTSMPLEPRDRRGIPLLNPGGTGPAYRADGGRLTAEDRRELPSSDFALPGRGSGKSGKGSGSYPIPDASHARNALARVAQHGTPEEKAEVRAKVARKFPAIKEG